MKSTSNPLFEHLNPLDETSSAAAAGAGSSGNVRSIDGRFYAALYPVDLTLETSRPSDPEDSFTVSLFDRSGYYSSTLPEWNPNHPRHRKELHQHDYFELLYVNHGDMIQNIENSRHVYPEGSLCLLNRRVRHREEFDTAFQCVFVGIQPKLVEEMIRESERSFFPNEDPWKSPALRQFLQKDMSGKLPQREYMDFIPAGDDPAERQEMHDRFEYLIRQFVKPGPGSTYIVKGLLSHIISALTDETLYQTVPIRVGTTAEAELFDELSSLMEKSCGRISRSQLVKELHYEGSYLNQIVHKFTGLSIFEYGTSVCMKEAARLLTQTDLSVQEIADRLRFTNRTHFYRLFEKTWGTTPRQYRLRISQGKD